METKTMRKILFTLAVALLLVTQAYAQTSLTSTTLSAAVSSTQTVFAIASATGTAAGDLLFVDHEAMKINAISGTNVTVSRGYAGTAARAHGTAAIVYTGLPAEFYSTEVVPGSACTAANETYTPRIVLPTGNLYQCVNSVWEKFGSEVGAITVSCSTGALVTGSVDQSCWTADRDYVIVKITEVHRTAESGGTVTLIPRRQQSTEAPASGDALTASAIDMVGAGAVAETVKTPTLTSTAAYLLLDAGDRLGLDFTDDTPGELANVVVTFTLVPR